MIEAALGPAWVHSAFGQNPKALMKPKRIIVILILLVIVGYVVSIVPNVQRSAERRMIISALRNATPTLVRGAEAFSRDQKSTNSPLPATVPLNALVSSGHIRAEDVGVLGQMAVVVSLMTDDAQPERILARVRLSDGSEIGLFADGSIRGLPK